MHEPAVNLSEDDVERLARLEHDSWWAERAQSGWQPGAKRDNAKQVHPAMVAWEELSEDVKEYDREVARYLPKLLADAGFAIVPGPGRSGET